MLPENTLSSVLPTLEQGVDFVEVDFRMTMDGVIVLNHDADLRRVAGVPYRVSELSYYEISVLVAGSHFSGEFEGESISSRSINGGQGKGKDHY